MTRTPVAQRRLASPCDAPRRGCRGPPRLAQGHPSSAPRRSEPPLTELAPLSPRGRGAGQACTPLIAIAPAFRAPATCDFTQPVHYVPPRLSTISPAFTPLAGGGVRLR